MPRSRESLLLSLRAAALLLAALALGACAAMRTAALPDTELPVDWGARRSVLQSWPGFELRGRVAVARGDEGFSGALRWTQTGARARLEVDGPLGVGGARYDLDPAEADGAALERAIGAPVPVASLRYWLLGVPDPASVAEESLDAGSTRLASLRQAGWSVAYTRYAPVPATRLELPQLIEVSREGLRVRLLIEGWQGVRP